MPNDHGSRDRVAQWRGTDVWERIDQAIRDEMARTRVGAKFIPRYSLPPEAQSVPSQVLHGDGELLRTDEGTQTGLSELSVQFALTEAQVDDEARLGTAVTLATRAANALAQAEDALIFVGLHRGHEVYAKDGRPIEGVDIRGANEHEGLVPLRLCPDDRHRIAGGFVARFVRRLIQPWKHPDDGHQGRLGGGETRMSATFLGNPTACNAVPVLTQGNGVPSAYGQHTFSAVKSAYSKLQCKRKNGPYALALPTSFYADASAPPSAGNLGTFGTHVEPLIGAGIFTAAALPDAERCSRLHQIVSVKRLWSVVRPWRLWWPERIEIGSVGVFLSLGGNSVDLAVGVDATTAFTHVDEQGRYRFRVYERVALRVKDRDAIVFLLFQKRKRVEDVDRII